MNSNEFDEELAPPFLHLVTDQTKDEVMQRFVHDRTFVARLSGEDAQTTEAMLKSWGTALSFPSYYGMNWPAFDECIADLEWLSADGYVLVVTEADQLFSRDSPTQIEVLCRILHDAAQEWALTVELGESWDRAAKPFHVLFHVIETNRPIFLNYIADSGVPLDRFGL